jgi:hypothetical protein
VNFYRIEAYTTPHAGRVRVTYGSAKTPSGVVEWFTDTYPDRVIRSVWQLVPPNYYTPTTAALSTAPSTALTTQDTQEKQ